MITTRQDKEKTTIIIPRRLRKKELDRVVEYISYVAIKPRKTVTGKQIQELADRINEAAWKKFKKMKGIK